MSKKKNKTKEQVAVSESGEIVERVETFRVVKAFVLENGKRYEPGAPTARKHKVYEAADFTDGERAALLEMEAIEIIRAEVPEITDEETVL